MQFLYRVLKMGLRLYRILWKIGGMTGCHQLPERSLYIKGKQFPVCARCTGAFLGYAFGGILFFFVRFKIWVSFLFCAVMFIDWLIQYLGIAQSNNTRRVITGFLCGIGLIQIYYSIIVIIICCFIK